MKTVFFISFLLLTAGCSRRSSTVPPTSDSTPTADSRAAASIDTTPAADLETTSPTEKAPIADADKTEAVAVKPLTAEQQEQLLSERLDGGMGYSFGQFANMFLVSSRIQLSHGVGLMASSRAIAEVSLQSPFPSFYKPTLREFLDAIALQTLSEWKYDPTSKHFKSEGKLDSPVEGLAIFEFTRTAREKPFEVTLAEGWKPIDKGNWLMLVPPSFPVGMDIYEMGTYSCGDEAAEREFFENVRTEVALEWAQRVRKGASRDDLKPSKVGTYDALFFESMVPSQLEKEIRWRHWVFMVENKCYFVVSTILPEFEDKIFPDVVKMLASFRVKNR